MAGEEGAQVGAGLSSRELGRVERLSLPEEARWVG